MGRNSRNVRIGFRCIVAEDTLDGWFCVTSGKSRIEGLESGPYELQYDNKTPQILSPINGKINEYLIDKGIKDGHLRFSQQRVLQGYRKLGEIEEIFGDEVFNVIRGEYHRYLYHWSEMSVARSSLPNAPPKKSKKSPGLYSALVWGQEPSSIEGTYFNPTPYEDKNKNPISVESLVVSRSEGMIEIPEHERADLSKKGRPKR